MRSLGFLLIGLATAASIAHAESLAIDAKTTVASIPLDLAAWTLEDKIGQLLLVGLRNEEQIDDVKPGGVILYAWNVKSPEGTRALTTRIRQRAAESLKAPLLIAIDHEGGKVLRLRHGITVFPDAAAVGGTNDEPTSFRVGKAMGLELASLGINVNFAPVLDLGNARSFLENRIWSEDPVMVGKLATAFVQGLEASRVLGVAKHFPGHGGTLVDAHFHLPTIKRSADQLWNEDLVPFREAIDGGLRALMTAHVAIPSVDARMPASASTKFVTGLLRERMGFNGLVITDDIEMGGARTVGGESREDFAIRALVAGSDMVMIAWSKPLQKRFIAKLAGLVRAGKLPEIWLDEKVRKILGVKDVFAPGLPIEEANPWWTENLRRTENLTLAHNISREGMNWSLGNRERLRKELSDSWQSSWDVFLPAGPALSYWHSKRPSDNVESCPRRPDPAAVERVRTALRRSLKAAKGPLMVLTPPRASGSEECFSMYREELGRWASRPQAKPVLWAHQGLKPFLARAPASESSVGVVSLRSSSAQSLSALLEDLEGGTEFR